MRQGPTLSKEEETPDRTRELFPETAGTQYPDDGLLGRRLVLQSITALRRRLSFCRGESDVRQSKKEIQSPKWVRVPQ